MSWWLNWASLVLTSYLKFNFISQLIAQKQSYSYDSEGERVLPICIIFKMFYLDNWHCRWDKRMTRKWDNSFQNRAIWGIKHKSVAKGLTELLTKPNVLSASYNSLCNCKNVERFFCPLSEDAFYSKTVSTKHIKSVQKKTNYGSETLT